MSHPRDGEHFEATLQIVEHGRKYQLRIAVPPDIPVGRYTEAVDVLTSDPARPRLRVAVNVLVKPDIYVDPPDISFGRVNSDHLRKTPGNLPLLIQTFLVKRRDSEMTITSVTTDVPFLDIQQDPPERGQTFRFDVGLDDLL